MTLRSPDHLGIGIPGVCSPWSVTLRCPAHLEVWLPGVLLTYIYLCFLLTLCLLLFLKCDSAEPYPAVYCQGGGLCGVLHTAESVSKFILYLTISTKSNQIQHVFIMFRWVRFMQKNRAKNLVTLYFRWRGMRCCFSYGALRLVHSPLADSYIGNNHPCVIKFQK